MKEDAILKKLYELQGLKSPDSDAYIEQWINDTKEEMAMQSAKAVGFGDALKSLKKIISSNKKNKEELAFVLRSSHKPWCVVTNGFCGVKLHGDYGLQGTSTQESTADNFIGLIDNYENECSKAVKLPYRDELDMIIRDWKATPKDKRSSYPLYDFGDGLPQFDAEKLKLMMPIFPTQTAHISPKYSKASPLYFSFELNSGILMPVRK